MDNMFCYQCEQTAGCSGCTGSRGVCGKTADVANLQDVLTGALIGLARATTNAQPTKDTWHLMISALFATLTNVNFSAEDIETFTRRVHEETRRLVPDCGCCQNPCGHNDDYDMRKLWSAQEDIRSLKSLILFGVRGMAAYAHHAYVLGYEDETLSRFFAKALFAVGEDWGMEALLPLVLEVGEKNLACMALLDRANTETFGNPVPTQVPLTVEKGPFIVVSGHDLRDLKLLLEQTDGKGVNIYTHGEMLPAHGYPELKKHPQLKGNFGTAWQSQQKEFQNIPAPVLFTTNCLMPPKDSYADRVYTTSVVGYPGMQHIGKDKDFSSLIEHAIRLGGYPENQSFTGINGGTTVTTGFAANTVLTLACGKYRFNDLDLGTIGGIPRLLDIGQCNDAYSAIRIAIALADAFHCSVNELPLSMVLSWYEQKAVAILLTLLHLGIENIRLGPTLPAFVSPNVLSCLAEHYHLAPTTTPEEDLQTLLGA